MESGELFTKFEAGPFELSFDHVLVINAWNVSRQHVSRSMFLPPLQNYRKKPKQDEVVAFIQSVVTAEEIVDHEV